MRPDKDTVREMFPVGESLDCPLLGGVSVGLCIVEGVLQTMVARSTGVSPGLLWLDLLNAPPYQ